MTTRSTLKHIVSSSRPTSANLGDEWFDPDDNKLYKNIAISGTSPTWIEVLSTVGTTASTSVGNLTVTGNLTVGAGGVLNVANFTQTINLAMPGEITAPVTGAARFYPSRRVTLTAVNANLGVAPSGDFRFVIKKNGVSLGTIFTITAQNPLMNVVYLQNIPLDVTDYLTLDIQPFSAIGNNLLVKISYI